MERNKNRKSKPSAADVAAARRLKAVWEARSRKERPTQECIGEQFEPPISQSAVSQYLNGGTALNTEAVLIFSAALGLDPGDIRTDLPLAVYQLCRSKVAPASKWPFALSRDRFEALPEPAKRMIDRMIITMADELGDPGSGLQSKHRAA